MLNVAFSGGPQSSSLTGHGDRSDKFTRDGWLTQVQNYRFRVFATLGYLKWQSKRSARFNL